MEKFLWTIGWKTLLWTKRSGLTRRQPQPYPGKTAMALQGKKAILAVTGGIAAFKALAVVRLLRQHGADPFVVMTAHATQFIAPESFAMWSGHPVSVDLFAPLKTWDMEHIALAHGADLVLVAPATANFLAKLATGVRQRRACRGPHAGAGRVR